MKFSKYKFFKIKIDFKFEIKKNKMLLDISNQKITSLIDYFSKNSQNRYISGLICSSQSINKFLPVVQIGLHIFRYVAIIN